MQFCYRNQLLKKSLICKTQNLPVKFGNTLFHCKNLPPPQKNPLLNNYIPFTFYTHYHTITKFQKLSILPKHGVLQTDLFLFYHRHKKSRKTALHFPRHFPGLSPFLSCFYLFISPTAASPRPCSGYASREPHSPPSHPHRSHQSFLYTRDPQCPWDDL